MKKWPRFNYDKDQLQQFQSFKKMHFSKYFFQTI